jgi:metal-dependent amidase/aminoacylase/carboxypeptidase family protein
MQGGYPATVNSYPECNAVVIAAATRVVGSLRAAGPQKTMGAEDFSFFLEKIPGKFIFICVRCTLHFTDVLYLIDHNNNTSHTHKYIGCFFFVGAALPGETRPHHKSVFDFDEVN